MNYKKLAFVSVVFLLLPLALSLVLEQYYSRYEMLARHVGKSLSYDDSTANAIKHATAASDMFSVLRLAMGSDNAEKAVILLGVMNEYIEQAVYPNDQDSAREIMKDLHNNYVGIEAAKLADKTDAFRIILSLADNRTLIVNQSYNPFYESKGPKEDVVAFGYNWFDEHREEIDSRLQMKLRRIAAFSQTGPIKLSSLVRKSPIIE